MEQRSPSCERLRECIYFTSDNGHLHATTSRYFQIAAPITVAIYLSIEPILSVEPSAHVVGIGKASHTHCACVVRTLAHSVTTIARDLLAVHVNPTHSQFRRLQAIGESGVLALEHECFASLGPMTLAACRGQLSLAEAADLFDEVVERSVRQLPSVQPAASNLSALLARKQAQSNSPLGELAQELGVCYERASRVFKEVTGTTLRSYRLWLKLQGLQRALPSGRSLTDIAHELGFTDLAHMTRLHGRCFGYPPSRFLRDDVLIVGPEC